MAQRYAFSRHDLDAFLAICDPDMELVAVWWRSCPTEAEALEVAGSRE